MATGKQIAWALDAFTTFIRSRGDDFGPPVLLCDTLEVATKTGWVFKLHTNLDAQGEPAVKVYKDGKFEGRTLLAPDNEDATKDLNGWVVRAVDPWSELDSVVGTKIRDEIKAFAHSARAELTACDDTRGGWLVALKSLNDSKIGFVFRHAGARNGGVITVTMNLDRTQYVTAPHPTSAIRLIRAFKELYPDAA